MAPAFNVKTESKKAYVLFDTYSLRSCIRKKNVHLKSCEKESGLRRVW